MVCYKANCDGCPVEIIEHGRQVIEVTEPTKITIIYGRSCDRTSPKIKVLQEKIIED